MAVADKAADFAIETEADALITRVSGAVANVILRMASQKTKRKTKNGLPLVTVPDIVESARALSQALSGVEGFDLSAEAKDALLEMRRIAQELANSGPNAKN